MAEPPRLHLCDVAVAFRHPLTTADGTYPMRHSVLVGFEHDGVTGWGEAAAFPSGRWGTIDQAWDALVSCDPEGRSDMPLADAALQAAHRDHAARLQGTALYRALGGRPGGITARLTVGLVDEPADLVRRVTELVATGARAVKLKIGPGRDTTHVAAVRAEFPALALSVDANGAYPDPDDPVFATLDRLGVDVIEQPLPPGDLAGCARLRTRLEARICVDEDLRAVSDAMRVVDADAADVLAVKSMRLGYEASLQILERCRAEGVGVKAGGTFDTAIGRHHVLAFATLDGVVDAEAGPPAAYLVDPLGDYPGFVDGTITPIEAPGIGITPDPGGIAAAVRSLTVEARR
ncbi:MAG: hypothetical protein HZA58_01665 [Acidimicrobiia bacterium]|nr:hypothetical protein [Acidimicrobiia bacterium]